MHTLQNHFLLAMPSLQAPYFERSLVYLCEHNAEGAMGLVINIPTDMQVDELLEQVKIDHPATQALKQPVLQGGPVASDRGFVLHSHRAGFGSSLTLSDELMVTTSRDILETLGTAEAPSHWLVTLGYAGWSAGQLEQELSDGAWLIVPVDTRLIFATPVHERWGKAAASIGINTLHLSSQIGHA
ncbi:YqgE/AlgH family protein [Aeromonas simiae]|uniref:YqgE/AlgH family protein n=1 Tax=Aeromonas simiae TaxID=218936 RepID=UPI00266B6AF6|nr:YqgE/AlgH family protein [Aeromonas simiae]MDO2950285.1 YqgE/AlgH family protein [Aeromonas simiae]MDO2953966.1 YqgE/AlgH family protein [Aeromonas simiae]MDO2957708.1 YqgE/AlgH family protein [Aeromonas simiae]